jgi:HrpA-like RNA helicase
MNNHLTERSPDDSAQESVVDDGLVPPTDTTVTDGPMPQEQSIEEYEAEIDRLATEAEEEAARLSGEHYSKDDMQREIEFGQMEALRERHFATLEQLGINEKKGDIQYPVYEHMVDGLMPLNEVHIIAGESGAGKSTWLFQFIHDWQQEHPVLGRKAAQ